MTDPRRAHSIVGNNPFHPSHDQPHAQQQPDSLQLVQQEALQLLGQRQKRRKRVRYSCTECHRRKHKCDRETPCGKCIERGVAAACIPHDGNEQDTFERMRQLESLLERLVEASRETLETSNSHSKAHAPVASAAAETSQSTPFSPSISTPSNHSTTDTRQRAVSTPRRRSNPGISTASSLPLRAQIGSETLEFSSAAQTYPPSVHFDRLVREGNLPKDEIRTLASSLPPQHQTSTLLDIFFRDINPLFFPFDEVWFRQAVNPDVIWNDPDHLTYTRDAPDHISVIALLYAILALTFLSQPRSMGSEADGAAQAARMSFQCRQCHMLAMAIQCHDPFIVASHMLLARFLILQRQAKESWLVFATAVREAEILGLHRLGPPPPPPSGSVYSETGEVAVKRTIWVHLYSEASFKCLIVGQTPLIHDSFCDTQPAEPLPPAGKELLRFDMALILRIRFELSRLVGRALELFLSDQHEMDSDAIFALDNELQRFKQLLPLPYRMDDKGRDGIIRARSSGIVDDDPFRHIVLHRYVLHSSIFILEISLHLPHLRRGSAQPGFERSRQAAIAAAVQDFRARQELRQNLDWPEDRATDRFVGGRFSHFHATSTLGICLLSEPDPERVRELAPLLDDFLEAQDHGGKKGDPCIRQELGIVGLIRARIRRKLEGRVEGRSVRVADGVDSSSANSVVHSAQHTDQHSFDHLLQPNSLDVQAASATHPELGEDMHEWWFWLVSSLDPSSLTPDTAAAEQRTQAG